MSSIATRISTTAATSSRALEVLRTEGVAGFTLRALDATVYRRLLVHTRSLLAPAPPRLSAGAGGAEFSLLGAEEVEEYRRLRPDTPAAEVRRRLDAGQRCIVARLGGEVVHARWCETNRFESAYLGFAFELLPGFAYSYDAFTAMRARRLGIAFEATRHSDALLRSEGAVTTLGSVWPGNTAAIAMFTALGRTPIGSLGALCLGRRRRLIRRRIADGYLGAAHRFSPSTDGAP